VPPDLKHLLAALDWALAVTHTMWSSYCLLWHCACAPFLHWPALQQLFLKTSLILQVLSRNGQTSTPEYLRLCKAVQSVNPKALLFDDADALSVLDKLKLNASQCRRPQQSLCATLFCFCCLKSLKVSCLAARNCLHAW
jgi:hypothetical protein